MQDFNRAHQLNPKLSYVYNNRGNLRAELGDDKGAIDDYNEAIRRDPKYAGTYFNRACTEAALGNEREAMIDYKKARQFDPEKTRLYKDPIRELRKIGSHRLLEKQRNR